MCGYKGRYPLNTKYLLNGLFYLQFASIVPRVFNPEQFWPGLVAGTKKYTADEYNNL